MECEVLWRVCLSVCLSAHITQKLRNWTSPNFLCTLPVAVTQSSSDSIAICYVLLVSRMTSHFHTMGPTGRIKHDVMFTRVRQVAVPVGRQDNYSVWWNWSECRTGRQSLLSIIDLFYIWVCICVCVWPWSSGPLVRCCCCCCSNIVILDFRVEFSRSTLDSRSVCFVRDEFASFNSASWRQKCTTQTSLTDIINITTLQPFNRLFSTTTWVSRQQKGRTILDFNEARDDGWQWHQLTMIMMVTYKYSFVCKHYKAPRDWWTTCTEVKLIRLNHNSL